jgi:chromate transporter
MCNLAIWFAIPSIFREAMPVHGYGLSFGAPLLPNADLKALGLRRPRSRRFSVSDSE